MMNSEEKKVYMKDYNQRPEVKERTRLYRQRQDVREKYRLYHQRQDVKEKQLLYRQKPEVKERYRLYSQRRFQTKQIINKKITEEWNNLSKKEQENILFNYAKDLLRDV